MKHKLRSAMLLCVGLLAIAAISIGTSKAANPDETVDTIGGYQLKTYSKIYASGISAESGTTHGGGGSCNVSATFYALDTDDNVIYTVTGSDTYNYYAIVNHSVRDAAHDYFYKAESVHHLTYNGNYHTYHQTANYP